MNLTEKYWKKLYGQITNKDLLLMKIKQRFGKSGHSIPVDVELPAAIPPETLWHGTGEKYVASIDQQGLIPKGRLYVHLSSDAATATKVGSRHGKPVLYIVKTKDMYDDGYSFFLSKMEHG